MRIKTKDHENIISHLGIIHDTPEVAPRGYRVKVVFRWKEDYMNWKATLDHIFIYIGKIKDIVINQVPWKIRDIAN